MLDEILNIIAPHHCITCGKLGPIWCDSCKNDIVKPLTSPNFALLQSTILDSDDFNQLIILSNRDDKMAKLINVYKFRPCRALAKEFSGMLVKDLPVDEQFAVIPLPSSPKHIKQRGFDHVGLIARYVASAKKYDYMPVLKRNRQATQQIGKNRAERIENAKNMFYVNKILDSSRRYLLIDDVLTTGATVKYACSALRAAGAKDVSLLIIARQNLK